VVIDVVLWVVEILIVDFDIGVVMFELVW